MKLSDIAKKYHIKAGDFEQFLYSNKLAIDYNALYASVKDEFVEEYVILYFVDKQIPVTDPKLLEKMAEINAKKAEDEKIAAEAEAEKQRKLDELSKILISSGFSFEGYSIVKYSGYISGDDSVEISRSLSANHGSDICAALVKIRRQALAELKEAAYNLGCNAVIGVDFDYITLEPETANFTGGTTYEPYVICVTANGNAVVIKKNNSLQS